MPPEQQRYSMAKKITLIGALVNALLGIIKTVGGALLHSHALIADGVHSFSDLLTDIMVVFASKYGSQDADESHPYGHQRIETAATLMLALLLILAGAAIAWHSVEEWLHLTFTVPGKLSLPIAVLSIIANEALFHYTQRIGKQIHSPLITANAWHHRSDAASSLVVLIGLIGSIAGFVSLDALAAIIVGAMIIKMGLSYGWSSVKELVDTAVPPDILKQIAGVIQQVNGVQKIHQLRSRSMGKDIYVDVHILVSSYISVSEGHYIAQHVHQILMDTIAHVKDVTVHVDPEDDETTSPSLHLPSRLQLENKLLCQWQRDYPDIQSWVVHYLDGALTVDLACNKKTPWETLRNRIETDIYATSQISRVRLFSEQENICFSERGAPKKQ